VLLIVAVVLHELLKRIAWSCSVDNAVYANASTLALDGAFTFLSRPSELNLSFFTRDRQRTGLAGT
jgi:hypothetical protein